ncbi:MAG: DNA-processing protein DprA [Actinomycetota bacterium]
MDGVYRAALACLPQMNPMALPNLLRLAGGARELWEVLKAGGNRASSLVGAEKAAAWRERCRGSDPSRIMAGLRERGIAVVSPQDSSFPQLLRSIYDPPALLFMMGQSPPPDAPYVAVVGARKASSYGRWAAESLGEELAGRGVVVVSGAAYGVDGHAHQGCLKAGGFTVAVLGCGIDRAYPPEHAGLLRRIAAAGCVLSEYPPGESPLAWRFPHRNRIIAGMSHAVVVVEASEKSGALITADMALEEGREVMAVPGPIGSALSLGANRLIQKGAKLVMEVEDICEELPFTCLPRELRGDGTAGAKSLAPLESLCIGVLEGGPRGLDGLAAAAGVPPGEILACMTAMFLRGWVAEEPGGRYRLLVNPCLRG